MNELRLSVVIPTYNRLDRLRYVIPSLVEQDLGREAYEIVVADSNSNDGTAEYLAEKACEFPSLRHLPGPYTGRAMARNAGIAAARAPIVLFTDADIIASRDLLSRHLDRHEATARPCAIVGQEVQVSSLEDYLAQRADPKHRRTLHPPSRKRLSWLYFLTGNASVPRAELERVGRFDETFTGYGHEDLELGYRLRKAGIPIYYEPRAVNYHWHPVPYSEQKGRMELAGRSTARFYRKHRSLDVQTRLGMTPLSLALHSLIERSPLRAKIASAGERPGFGRTLSFQYHYLNGVKAGLGDGQSR